MHWFHAPLKLMQSCCWRCCERFHSWHSLEQSCGISVCSSVTSRDRGPSTIKIIPGQNESHENCGMDKSLQLHNGAALIYGRRFTVLSHLDSFSFYQEMPIVVGVMLSCLSYRPMSTVFSSCGDLQSNQLFVI